jgi:uroporphyrinogen-III synthase
LDFLLNGRVHAALFTTGVQVDHFLDFAGKQGTREEAISALKRIFVASIGPDTTETLKANEVNPVLEPSHPKMGLLVREAAEKYSQTKR